jgi:1,2-diacylglycerol 3-beta-galactosyltransferase
MNKISSTQPRIVFLFSDTGGGHRSAAEAIIEAIHLEYKDQVVTEMVDIFKDYAPRPLNYMPDLYPKMVRVQQVWGLGYYLSNGDRRARLLMGTAYPYVRRSMLNLVHHHPADLYVSVHPLANVPVLRALGDRRPPYVTVVTDLVTTHALWYHRKTDLCIVPTQEAGQRAIKFGLKAEQVSVVGLPVADRFCQPVGSKQSLRAQLNWPQDLPIVLLVGGGEGMGPLEKTAQAINSAQLPAALVVICGRNVSLKKRLESVRWDIPTLIYGFTREMPAFMQAADILVTKAGPGTISEALNAGLPMVLYSRLPGQEDGNVSFIVSEQAGVWAPRAESIVAALRKWLDKPHLRQQAAENARRLANPRAARQIAQILMSYLTDGRSKLGQPPQRIEGTLP